MKKAIEYLESLSDTKYDKKKQGWIVYENVDLSNMNLVQLPKFIKVYGYFDCSNNQLTSLEGSPQEVDGFFSCFNNKLVSLKGAPQIVNGFFDCSNNQIISLKSGLHKINGFFDCSYNKLQTLDGILKTIDSLNCSHNDLQTLEGIGKNNKWISLNCSYNKTLLTTFATKYIPEKINNFIC